ncbi:hypothetical protein FPV67DRAFT_1448871 [Lyophyllum atratum]|nr:hypothetical protein FPV67DRAFT_1448871 [Lyophyllum atratum]
MSLETVVAGSNIGSFLISLLTLGQCKSNKPCELTSNIEFARKHLDQAFDELKEYGRLYTTKEFDTRREQCIKLQEELFETEKEQAANTSILISRRRSKAMSEAAGILKANCVAAYFKIKDTSAIAQRRGRPHLETPHTSTDPFADSDSVVLYASSPVVYG